MKNCVMGDNGFILPDGVAQEGEDCEGVAALGGVDIEEVTVLRGVEMEVCNHGQVILQGDTVEAIPHNIYHEINLL